MSRWSSGAETDVSVAENYQRYLEPVLFAPWAHRLVAYAGVRPGDTVLDLAAGTGAVSRVAARAGASVIAADSSARVTVVPPSSTGSMFATGVSAPVRPTCTVMARTVVIARSAGNL